MLNLITAANGKLDNPIMQEWAIHFYSHLPKNAQAERIQIESDWFHELFIAQLIDRGDASLLSHLFRELPPQFFSNVKNLIIKNWTTWPASVVSSAAHILAVDAPDELKRLYTDDLAYLKQGAKIDPQRFSFIHHLLPANGSSACNELADELAKIVIEWKDDFRKSLLFYPLLNVSKQLSADVLESLIDTVLQREASEHRLHSLFQSLFEGLFGNNDYLGMVFDRENYESPLTLTALRPFFVDSAPLEKLDNWLDKLPPSEQVLSLLETLSDECAGCRILLGLLKDSKRISAKLSHKTHTQLALAACIHGLTKTTLDTSGFDLMTTLNLLAIDLLQTQWNSQLIDNLGSFDQHSVTAALMARLQEDSDDFGAIHIAEAMGELGYPAFIEPLIAAISDDKGDYLCEAAREALTEIGSAAQAALIAQWDDLDRSQEIFGLTVIRSIHNKAAADFAVTRFSDLLAKDLEFTCELIIASPDLRLLELLKPELRRKQPLLDRAFYISARLLDYDGPEVDSTRDHAFAEYQRSKQAMDAGALPQYDHLYLELECLACGAVNRYEAKGVVIADDPRATCLLADEFPCLSCGEDVEFKFTSMARIAISANLITNKIQSDAGQLQDPLVKAINYSLDGQVMPLASALSTIRTRLATNPQDARQWYRLGNLLSQLNRPKATIDAYQKAVTFAPNAVDTVFALAHTLADSQREADALQVLQDALERLSSWTFLSEFPDFGHAFADLYNHLRRRLRKPDVPALHSSALSSPQKLGRNDPCSCGSDKKFKKCCGR